MEFQVPAPPSPIPEKGLLERSIDWVERNPFKTLGILTGIGIAGTGLLVGYSRTYRRAQIKSTERKQVVVVLGGDTRLALPLILDLEKKGYIVIASVSSPESVETLEGKCQGYVRALVLNPNSPDTIPVFLRSLNSTLSRKFPLTAAGDPFVSTASHRYIHSIISLLTLPPPSPHAPLEHINLLETYIPYLTTTQITPLSVIQSLLPMMRLAHGGKKSIIFCVPATEARIGLPFSSVQSMSAVSTLRAAQVLRREIRVAAMTGKSEWMNNIRVVVVDVGLFSTEQQRSTGDVYRSMESWTPSEKLTYGPAFASLSYKSSRPISSNWESFVDIFNDSHQYGVPRHPTPIRVFVDSVTGVVSNGTFGPTLFGFGLGLGRVQNWIRGERFSIGAGAQTYRFASFLPSLILETLLNIPHFLISIRNTLLPTQPFIRPRSWQPARRHAIEAPPTAPDSDPDSGNHSDTTGSEADVESNEGESEGDPNTESWVNLPPKREDGEVSA